jgi:hypothetical protein
VVQTAYLVLHDRQRAEDVAQEAFTQLFVHWKRVSRYQRPDAWVWDGGSTFTVEGDTLTLVYASGGTSTLRWRIEGDRLDLELLEDTQADVRGLPADIWVAALYTADRFERVGS